MPRAAAPLALLGLLTLWACDPQPMLDEAALRDPATCQPCHPAQHKEWSGSMHAYAAEDPVFLAMNARGQRETGGQLGDFCVRCHAPLALRLGLTRDGTNLAQVQKELRGVTCYFCHTADAVEGTHNNPLRLASDGALRGGIMDPATPRPHEARYASPHDRNSLDSAALCGSCHDIVTPAGVELERTYKEWQGSLFSTPSPAQRQTCGQCHMPGRLAPAADVPGAPLRRVHDHSMPGVDVALTPFPETEAQRAAIQRDLDPTLLAKLCVYPDRLLVTLDNVGAGHAWPSGAAQDRRAWVELIAYSGDTVVFRSGEVAEGQPAAALADPALWLLRDRIFDGAGKEVHMFWEAARYQSSLLPPAVTADPLDPRFFHAVEKRYDFPGRMADRVTLRVRIRPLPLETLDDLVRSGDLAPEVRGRVPTFTLAGTVLEWRRASGMGCVPEGT